MSTRLIGRTIAPLLAAIAVAGSAGSALAQAPTKARAGTSPTMLSDCDYMQGSCGGAPYLDGFGVGSGGNPGGASGFGDTSSDPRVVYICDGGNLTECRRVTRDVCARWVTTAANGQVSVSVGPGTGSGAAGAGATWTCTDHSVEVTIIRLRRVVIG